MLQDRAHPVIVIADLQGRGRDDDVGLFADARVLGAGPANVELGVRGEVPAQPLRQPPPLAGRLTDPGAFLRSLRSPDLIFSAEMSQGNRGPRQRPPSASASLRR